MCLELYWRGEGPQSLLVERRHFRTSPWRGQDTVNSTSIAIAFCLPLRGNARESQCREGPQPPLGPAACRPAITALAATGGATGDDAGGRRSEATNRGMLCASQPFGPAPAGSSPPAGVAPLHSRHTSNRRHGRSPRLGLSASPAPGPGPAGLDAAAAAPESFRDWRRSGGRPDGGAVGNGG
jgi:hypothetical protein